MRELSQARAGAVEDGLSRLAKARFSARLWKKDPSLWKQEKAHQELIRRSLGWLRVPEAMAAGLGPVRAFASEARAEGFNRAVVLGMGGSSLACEVFRTCFAPAKGHPALEVLDSTSPEAVSSLESRLDLKRALFIVSSKSGSTIEPNCFLEHFYERVSRLAGPRAGRQFAAITDPGTSLERLARSRRFRRVFANPADIGGRYSALSFFGLVPAALMGVDVGLLLDRARAQARALSPETTAEENPALRLGAALGGHALQGRDKLTLTLSPAIESLGLWIEQLVAESTGKEGRGVIPVTGEPLGPASAYGQDRLFVRISLSGSAEGETEERLSELKRAGHPILSLTLRDAYDLGAQFFLWEVATAAGGLLLGVNPFDQPDVQSAKDRTQELLSSLKKGRLGPQICGLRAGGLPAFCDAGLLRSLRAASPERTPQLPLAEVLEAHLSRLRPGDYCALLAFLEPGEDNRSALESLRKRLRELTGAAVVVQFGPRYLHSTGQLYKGGGDRGLFLQLTRSERPSPAIPGKPFGFSTLHEAQARGDFAAMIAARRRILRLELQAAPTESLSALSNALAELARRRKPCAS